jgi:hypothetical protein
MIKKSLKCDQEDKKRHKNTQYDMKIKNLQANSG